VLVPAGDAAALAAALVRVLGDPAIAERLGAAGEKVADKWAVAPEVYAARVGDLVREVAG